jgi:hypothetical protein
LAAVLTGPAADVALCATAANTQDGCPRRGRELHQRAGEVHAASPDAWDGKGNVPPGWSDWRASIAPAPVDEEADTALQVGDLADLRIQGLPPGPERGALASARAKLRQEERE